MRATRLKNGIKTADVLKNHDGTKKFFLYLTFYKDDLMQAQGPKG